MIEKSLTFQFLSRVSAPLAAAVRRRKIRTGRAPLFVLAFMLFCVFFIPRLSLPVPGLAYAVDLRMEDFLFLALLVLAFIRRTENIPENLMPPEASPQIYFTLFLAAASVSILAGLFAGTIDKPWLSLLYLLKWVEYAGLFFLSLWLIRTREDCVFLTRVFFGLGLALALYGYAEYGMRARYSLSYYRLYERFPFYGDANHAGAFFVIWIAFFTALFLRQESLRRRLFLLAGLVFVWIPFLGCQSKKSLLALAASFAVCFILSPARRRLVPLFLIFAAAGLFLTPGHFVMRFHKPPVQSAALPAQGQKSPETLFAQNRGFGSDEAEFYTGPDADQAALFLTTWRWMLRGTEPMILWGCGLGARHRSLYESQYVLLLSETGFTGLIFFILLCLSPLKTVWPARNAGGFAGAAAQGWILALAGLLVHNLTCISLSVVKVAVPFWVLTAVVLRAAALKIDRPDE